MDDLDFEGHYDDLNDLRVMMQETTTNEKVLTWINKWRNENATVDDDDWSDRFPGVQDILIKEENNEIWIEKEIFQKGIMLRISMQVF